MKQVLRFAYALFLAVVSVMFFIAFLHVDPNAPLTLTTLFNLCIPGPAALFSYTSFSAWRNARRMSNAEVK